MLGGLRLRRTASLLLAFVLLFGSCGGGSAPAGQGPTAAASPGAGQFRNPVFKQDFADPGVLKVGDTYYAYATGETFFDPANEKPGRTENVSVARSKDLVTWEDLGEGLPKRPAWQANKIDFTWAPEVAKTSAGYVMYYTTKADDQYTRKDDDNGPQCISVAVAQKPEGPFVDSLGKPFVCQNDIGGSIDAFYFKDDDGKAYLFWKNDGNCCGFPTEIWGQQLSADGLRLVGRPRSLGVKNDALWEGPLIEAPTILKRDGSYHLFFSANNYASPDYAVGYATSQDLLGPYRDAPENPILKSKGEATGPGGQAIVEGPDGDLWILYHAWSKGVTAYEVGGARAMWLDRLEFQDGKPVVKGPTDSPQEVP